MNKPESLAALREKDRRLALLTLAGKRQPAGPCPSPEELAALVESRLPADRTDRCLAHLAECDECAALWLQLDRQWHEQSRFRRSGLLRQLSRPRTLTAAGSLLAAAASVALFLTLTLQSDRHHLIRMDPPPAQEETVTAPATSTPIPNQTPVRDAASNQPTSVAPAAPSLEAQSLRETLQPAARQAETKNKTADTAKIKKTETRQDMKSQSAPAAAPAEREQPDRVGRSRPQRVLPQESAEAGVDAETTATSLSITAPKANGKGTLSPDDWRKALRQECHQQGNKEAFNRLAAQGQTLLREHGQALASQERQRIGRLLTLLTGPLPGEERCRAILEELGPANSEAN